MMLYLAYYYRQCFRLAVNFSINLHSREKTSMVETAPLLIVEAYYASLYLAWCHLDNAIERVLKESQTHCQFLGYGQLIWASFHLSHREKKE
jgi:hypothetical protein